VSGSTATRKMQLGRLIMRGKMLSNWFQTGDGVGGMGLLAHSQMLIEIGPNWTLSTNIRPAQQEKSKLGE